MRARIIDRSEVLQLVDVLRRDREVIAPFRGRGRENFWQQ